MLTRGFLLTYGANSDFTASPPANANELGRKVKAVGGVFCEAQLKVVASPFDEAAGPAAAKENTLAVVDTTGFSLGAFCSLAAEAAFLSELEVMTVFVAGTSPSDADKDGGPDHAVDVVVSAGLVSASA